MKRLIGPLALAVSLALAPATVAQADSTTTPKARTTGVEAHKSKTTNARYGSGYFTVGTATLPASGCIEHPYRGDVSIGYETDGWYVETTVYDAAGAWAGGFVSEVYFDEWGTYYLEDTVTLCTGIDAPGTYRIVGTIHTVNSGSSVITEQAMTPATFAVNPYVAPTPPPPPPAPAPSVPPTTPATVEYADVKGTVSKKSITRGVKLTFKAKPIPVGAQIRNKLKWTIIKDNKVSSFTQKPDTKKVKTLTFKKGSGVHKIKVLRNGKVATKVTVRA